MNLRRKTPADSLYLLLDTLCNAFGGIILLAVLVVLLTSREKSLNPAATDSAELLQRRLEIAETNLQASLTLAASLEARARDGRLKEQMALLADRKDLADAIQAARDAATQKSGELDSVNAADPAERMKFLKARLAAVQRRKLDVQNRLDAEKETIGKLKQRVPGLEEQVAAKVAETERRLRLPKEHDTGKHVMYVIVRYGRAYPCQDADLNRNEVDIQWITIFSGESAVPDRSKGFLPDQMTPYFNSLSRKDSYVVFCVYEDSFSAYFRVREAAVDCGLAYGWEPFANTDPIVFGPMGHTPKPQ